MASPKSPAEMYVAMERNMPLKTGRSLAQWAAIVKQQGFGDVLEARDWLKRQHGLSTMYAWMAADVAYGGTASAEYADEEALLTAMYTGPRAQLRPVHDKLWQLGQKLGPEVQLVVCKTYCSFRAKTQFAVVKPTTQTALDLGLALPPDTVYTGRLVEAKNLGGGERNRHRIRLSSVKEVDAEVVGWLKAAYRWDVTRGK